MNSQRIQKIEDIPTFNKIEDIHNILHTRGCRLCELGYQPNINGCCVSRGSFNTKKMIIGEAPGKEEDARGTPFTGPAGVLMDQIWRSVGMDTNDWYITNVIHCRPIAPVGSGKQNLTPKHEQIGKCSIFINEEIRLLNPKIIVSMGAIATAAMLGINTVKMGDHRGKAVSTAVSAGILRGAGVKQVTLFPMLHPAALLHAKGNIEKYNQYRREMWQDVQKLKEILTNLDLL